MVKQARWLVHLFSFPDSQITLFWDVPRHSLRRLASSYMTLPDNPPVANLVCETVAVLLGSGTKTAW